MLNHSKIVLILERLGVTICVQEGGSTVNYANQQTQRKSTEAICAHFSQSISAGLFY